jgi:hypothetical protein
MTHRTEANPPTPIELATSDVVRLMEASVHTAFLSYHLDKPNKGFTYTEPEFRRMLALYFHGKSIAEWCRDLHIPDATDPTDKPDHGGES